MYKIHSLQYFFIYSIVLKRLRFYTQKVTGLQSLDTIYYHKGSPAGYVELQKQKGKLIEPAYFGRVPEFIGVGFGGCLLSQAVEKAWEWGNLGTGKSSERYYWQFFGCSIIDIVWGFHFLQYLTKISIFQEHEGLE